MRSISPLQSPMPQGEAIKIASAFTVPRDAEPEPEPDLPVMVAKLVVESAPNVLAYGAEPEAMTSPFAAVLNPDEPVSLVPKIEESDHAWAAQPLPLSVFSDREQHCLTAGIYFEARGEAGARPGGRRAGHSQPRQATRPIPTSICGVVYQNKDWRNRCQFSFACDKIKDKVNDPRRWEDSELRRARDHPWPDLADRGRLLDPLPRHVCEAALGAGDGEGGADRPARLLPDLGGGWS